MKGKRKDATGEIARIFGVLHNHFGPLGWWPGDSPFEIMVGAILTQNTTWANVEKAIANLKNAKTLTAKRLLALPPPELEKLLKPSGYFRVKAKRLRAYVEWFVKRFDGDAGMMKKEKPLSLRRELLSLHGVGRETADSILLYALGFETFVVDAYTKRIFSRHGHIDAKADYDSVKKYFEGAPRPAGKWKQGPAYFNELHAQIVMTGKDHCKPKARCETCPLKIFPHDNLLEESKKK